MCADRVWSLEYEGFAFRCRMVPHPTPRTEPVLLMGGAFMDMSGWRAVEKYLTPSTTVIAVDLPGQGVADPLPSEYGFSFQTAALGSMLDSIGVSRVNILGTSLGSMLAMDFARDYSEKIVHMILMGMPADVSRKSQMRAVRPARVWVKTSLSHLLNGRTEEFRKNLTAYVINHDPACAVRDRDTVIDILGSQCRQLRRDPHVVNTFRRMNAIFEERSRDEAAADDMSFLTSIQTLLVVGEYDHLTTPVQIRSLSQKLSNTQFCVVREADHIVHLERPAEIADLVVRFCDDESLDDLEYLNTM